MKTHQEKDIKFNPVSLYVPASRCLTWEYSVRIQKTFFNKSQHENAFPWYSLGNSLLHLFWPYIEHSHRSVYPLPWWLLGGRGLFTLPVAGPSIVSQGCLVPLFLGPSNCSCFRKASAWKLNLCITNNVVDVLLHSLDSSFLNWRASWSCSHQNPGSGPSPCH